MFGHGTFVYDPDHAISHFGSAADAVEAVEKMGMRHVWLRVHRATGPWRTTPNRRLADAARSRGLSVGVWGWNDGNDVGRDIDNAEAAISTFEPDTYIADIEHDVSGANWSPADAAKLCRAAKAALGDRPLVVSSFGYITWHRPEIMTEIDSIADYFAPQVYWFWHPKATMLKGSLKDLPTNNAAAYAKVCLHEWRQVVSKPLILTGQAYWGEAQGWGRPQAENKLREFLDGFDEWDGLAGVNWWNLSDDRAMSPTMRSLIAAADLNARLGDESTADTSPVSSPSTSKVGSRPASEASDQRMVAAEELYFRSQPRGGDPSNIIASLDYSVAAKLTGPVDANGYHPATVRLAGTDTAGYLHGRYLRPVEAPLIERAVAEAVHEWKRFDKGAGLEDREPFSTYINEMWTAIGLPHLTGMHTGQPWSAAFISFVLRNAGYEATAFADNHSSYIHESIQNRITGANGDFWGYRIDEVPPQVGDLVCQWRKTETTFDEAEVKSWFSSHTDLVIAIRPMVAVTIGGNVVNESSGNRGVTVETKMYALTPDGYLPDRKRVFAIMKSRHRPD